jgi:short-subunit dehydrogenase
MGQETIMTRDLHGRRLVVTGASSGIGRAVAELAARQGARLVLAARSADKLDEVSRALTAAGADAVAVPADVTAAADRQRLLQTALDRFGGLDALVNNAGIASFGHFATSSEEVLRRIMEVNFFAPAELIRAAIPLLQQGREPAIVNVASMCGRRGLPAWPEYSASKYALCGLTEALRGEMARFDIDVLLILPGLTRNGLSRNLLRNEGRMKFDAVPALTSEAAAAAILRALVKNRTETVIGREARGILLLNRFFPRLLDWLLARKVRKLYAEG